jgi:histidyl-tRNA synthetase
MPDKPKRINPRLLKGFQDVMPDAMLARRKLIETVRTVYERYGFAPLDTPAMEYLETLTGEYGKESAKEIYDFTDRAGDQVALRYDLTVPLARLVAQYPDLPRPFRRYQIAPVWRFDKPGPGRFREFLQFDADTVGSSQMAADAEIISAIVESLSALGVQKFHVRFSNRKILNALVDYAGIPSQSGPDVFRVLDKLDKAGRENVLLELGPGRVDQSGDPIPGLGLPNDQIRAIERFLSITGRSRDEVITGLQDVFSTTPSAEEGIRELGEISSILIEAGIADDQAKIDVSVARGLDYYTGPIFEAILDDLPQFGAVFGGGRYDGLVKRFLGQMIPAVGTSVGVDRLLGALTQLKVLRTRKTTVDVLVTTMDKGHLDQYRHITRELRQAGINTEMYLGKPGQIGKQLKYADQLGIPLAVIAGEDEFLRGEISVKNLHEGKAMSGQADERQEWLAARFGQQTIRRADLIAFIKEALSAV